MQRSDSLTAIVWGLLLVVAAPITAQSEVKLVDGDGVANDRFSNSPGYGPAIALEGDVLAVGSAAHAVDGNNSEGSVTVFRRTAGQWVEEAELSRSDGKSGDSFGFAVAILGDVIAVSSMANGLNGPVTMFRDNGTNWIEEQQIPSPVAQTSGWFFGWSMSMDGDTLVVGMPLYSLDESSQGAAWVYRWNGSAWVLEQALTASNPQNNALFGWAVSVSGDAIAVGAINDDVQGSTDQGSVTVFRWDGSRWAEEAYLTGDGGLVGEKLGHSLSLSGSTLVAGAPGRDHGFQQPKGSVLCFRFDGTDWTEVQEISYPGPALHSVGFTVATDGTHLAVSLANSVPGLGGAVIQPGRVMVYRWDAGWVETFEFAASDGLPTDRYGTLVALSGDTLVASAPDRNVGGVSPFQGAVYVHQLGWTDLGGGSPGVAGLPTLTGAGSRVGGEDTLLSLAQSPPDALALAWISFGPNAFAALGGTVHAHPFSSQVLLLTDATGAISVSTLWPAGLPAATEIWFQCVIEDPSTPPGLTLSNGLKATTP